MATISTARDVTADAARHRIATAQPPTNRGAVIWFTGLSGAGKSTIAQRVADDLRAQGRRPYVLDGDSLRTGLCNDLGFSLEDRGENLRRAAEVARLLLDADLIVLCAFISPLERDRDVVRKIIGEAFFEVYVDASIDECINRDPKGHYRRALAGELPDFTGIDSPYEAPTTPDLRLDSASLDVDACSAMVLAAIEHLIAPTR